MPRRTATNSVSLFPFLAVLLCAMGALIVLLVILTHQIREDARQIVLQRVPTPSLPAPLPPESPPPAEPTKLVNTPPAAPVVAPIDPNLKLRARLEKLRRRREKFVSRLADQNQRLTKLASRKKGIVRDARAARLARDADARRLKARAAALDEREATIGEEKSQITRLAEELKAARLKAAGAPAKLQIVPYEGRSGTARKPILIECTAEAIRFMPEDVALKPADIEGFDAAFNPLLAGASALRNYWSVHGGPNSARPYILLVVRTDGIIAYYAARSLLGPLGTETGYILIGENQQIAYPELDPLAQEVCRDAVREALELRSAAQFLTARRDEQFRNNVFTVDPREHDPTRPDHDDDLFPVHRGARPTAPGARRESYRASGKFANKGANVQAPPGDKFGPRNQSPSVIERGSARIPGQKAPRGKSGNGIPRIEPQNPSLEIGTHPHTDHSIQLPARFNDHAGHNRVPSMPSSAGQDRRSGGSQTTSSPRNFLFRNDDDAPRKKRWGKSSPTAIISLEHNLTITVYDEVIQVADQPALLVGPDGLNAIVVEDVLRAIAREAHTWGEPPENFYWTPHIEAAVAPGGAFTFTRLRAALQRAGLRVSDHLDFDAPVPPPLERTHAPPSR